MTRGIWYLTEVEKIFAFLRAGFWIKNFVIKIFFFALLPSCPPALLPSCPPALLLSCSPPLLLSALLLSCSLAILLSKK